MVACRRSRSMKQPSERNMLSTCSSYASDMPTESALLERTIAQMHAEASLLEKAFSTQQQLDKDMWHGREEMTALLQDYRRSLELNRARLRSLSQGMLDDTQARAFCLFPMGMTLCPFQSFRFPL